LNDPFHSTHDPVVNPTYLPEIDYYVIAKNSEPNGSGTWHAIAFVDLYDPDGDDAHVDIQVPAGDTLYPYAMAAVYSDTKLFGSNGDDVASKKTLKGKSDKIDSPEVIYLADYTDPIKVFSNLTGLVVVVLPVKIISQLLQTSHYSLKVHIKLVVQC